MKIKVGDTVKYISKNAYGDSPYKIYTGDKGIVKSIGHGNSPYKIVCVAFSKRKGTCSMFFHRIALAKAEYKIYRRK